MKSPHSQDGKEEGQMHLPVEPAILACFPAVRPDTVFMARIAVRYIRMISNYKKKMLI